MSQDVFETIKNDHNKHRELLDKLAQTEGDTKERRELLEQFTREVKSHAAAEEQAVYATMLKKPPTTDETRHSVAEHHELDEALNDLAATDMSSPAWMAKFKKLDHEYRHHIREEEKDHFPEFEEHLTDADLSEMDEIFAKRKSAEKQEAEMTPEKAEDAKE